MALIVSENIRRAGLVGVSLVIAALAPAWRTAVAAEEQAGAATERRQRVLAFVAEHQPELAEVLASLEKRKPADHARAIEELDRSIKPLATGTAKDQRLQELELQAWQARTRVELLGARVLAAKGGRKITAQEREDLDRRLREAIAAELDAKAEQLAYRKQRSIAWYDRQIDRLTDKRDELVASRLKAILGDGR